METGKAPLEAEREHLASLLEAIQRCVYFLDASAGKLAWPLTAEFLQAHKKDPALFESLAAINERFAKLQDTLGAAMRHAYLLSGESGSTFLKVLAFFEKMGVINSIESWQLYRTTRNLAAHDYEIDYAAIAEHFNALYELEPALYRDAWRFVDYCRMELAVAPSQGDFSEEFLNIVRAAERTAE
ncbi:hypothetical protein [Methylohalobius crimeensis]|uniref:hypothetical protein n=1 Tax=Methylohalobius crimeensis TaxID=244365 RepID=UPI0003B4BE01|nr:hypothetical protein [Methylohalobius crimeensis]